MMNACAIAIIGWQAVGLASFVITVAFAAMWFWFVGLGRDSE